MSNQNYLAYDFLVTLMNPVSSVDSAKPVLKYLHYAVVATSALDAWKYIVSYAIEHKGDYDLQEVASIGVCEDGNLDNGVRPYFVSQTGAEFNPDVHFTPSTKETTENLAYEVD